MSDLHAKIDWFSFTFPIALLGEKDEQWTLTHILSVFSEHTGGRLENVLGKSLWEFSESSGFYSHSITHPIIPCRINWRAGNPHAQAVFSGQACELVLQSIAIDAFLSLANGRCTRLDIATDIATGLTPKDFVEAGYSDRILSSSHIVSPTGETAYVGSRSGERMARIYRYNSPHPRANLLRIEVELKGDAAKMAVEHGKDMSLTQIALSANLAFAWQHPIWNEEKIMVSKIPARPYDREGAETLKWLNEVVASAIWKAHRSGLINLDEWLEEHFKVSVG
jgi:hypothetical protein